MSKEDYFKNILPLIEEIETLMDCIEGELRALFIQNIDEGKFLTSTNRARVRADEIYAQVISLPFAPFECREVSDQFHFSTSQLLDVCIFYDTSNRSKWDATTRMTQSLKRVECAREALQHLEYELAKVR